MDVTTLAKSAVHNGFLHVQRNKTGRPVYLKLPENVSTALEAVPIPDGAEANCPYFFWDGHGTKENAAKATNMFLWRVFKRSGVVGARPHQFRHTLATEILGNGGTAEDVASILGNSPAIVRKHYALWDIKRQERISSLLQMVHSGTNLAHEEKQLASH